MDRIKIMSTAHDIKLTTAQHLLGEAGIESFVVDKSDSAYVGLLETKELYVFADNREKALQILDEADVIGDSL